MQSPADSNFIASIDELMLLAWYQINREIIKPNIIGVCKKDKLKSNKLEILFPKKGCRATARQAFLAGYAEQSPTINPEKDTAIAMESAAIP